MEPMNRLHVVLARKNCLEDTHTARINEGVTLRFRPSQDADLSYEGINIKAASSAT